MGHSIISNCFQRIIAISYFKSYYFLQEKQNKVKQITDPDIK